MAGSCVCFNFTCAGLRRPDGTAQRDAELPQASDGDSMADIGTRFILRQTSSVQMGIVEILILQVAGRLYNERMRFSEHIRAALPGNSRGVHSSSTRAMPEVDETFSSFETSSRSKRGNV